MHHRVVFLLDVLVIVVVQVRVVFVVVLVIVVVRGALQFHERARGQRFRGHDARRRFLAQVGKGNRAVLAFGGTERDEITEDVVADNLLFARSGRDDLPFLRKTLALLHVELVFVPQATHQAATGAGDLRGVQRRETLILCGARLHGAQFGEPRRRAELAAATSDAIETTRFVAHADVPHVHARREALLQATDELAEVHALLGGEEDRQLTTIPLPLGVGDLEVELEFARELNRRLAHGMFIGAETHGAVDFLRRRNAHDGRQLLRRCLAVRGPGFALVGELADAVHATEILAAIDRDNHRRLQRRRLLRLKLEEDAPIALELDFDQMRSDRGVRHSVNAPILRNFSRRRRTSLSGLRPLSSSMLRSNAAWTDFAVTS